MGLELLNWRLARTIASSDDEDDKDDDNDSRKRRHLKMGSTNVNCLQTIAFETHHCEHPSEFVGMFVFGACVCFIPRQPPPTTATTTAASVAAASGGRMCLEYVANEDTSVARRARTKAENEQVPAREKYIYSALLIWSNAKFARVCVL